MKVLSLFVCIVHFSLNALSQEESVVRISNLDSSNAFVQLLDRHNLLISQAYNGIGKGLQSVQTDSLLLALLEYKNTCENIYKSILDLPVAEHLNSVKISYCQWIGSIIEFNEIHLMKLEGYQNSKKQLLQMNSEADTKYVDGLIQEHFKLMDEAQNTARSNYMLELENLKQFHLHEAEDKK